MLSLAKNKPFSRASICWVHWKDQSLGSFIIIALCKEIALFKKGGRLTLLIIAGSWEFKGMAKGGKVKEHRKDLSPYLVLASKILTSIQDLPNCTFRRIKAINLVSWQGFVFILSINLCFLKLVFTFHLFFSWCLY